MERSGTGDTECGGMRNFSELRGQPGSQHHKLMGGRQSTHLCPVSQSWRLSMQSHLLVSLFWDF